MKATELRLQNLVLLRGKISEIELIQRSMVMLINTDSERKGFSTGIENIEPIPLTEEWLLKFGEIYWIRQDIDGIFYWFNGEKKYLNFVHSLQNTYFYFQRWKSFKF